MATLQYSQIRARNVLQAKNHLGVVEGISGGKNLIKGIPEKIINHGLLAAVVDSLSTTDEERVWETIISHLQDPEINQIEKDITDTRGLIHHLSADIDSRQLRLITSEVMEWLNFARRLI